MMIKTTTLTKNLLIQLFYCGAIALLSTGCMTMQAYTGNSKDNSETALLIETSYHPIYIKSVNGISVGFFHNKARLLPGENFLRVKVLLPEESDVRGIPMIESYFIKEITFKAKAGHVYRIDGIVNRNKQWVWVEDAESMEVVGGEKP